MIRQATLTDSQIIEKIYNQHLVKGESSMDVKINLEKVESWIVKLQDRESLFVFVEGDVIKGWAILKKYTDRYRFAGETSVYEDNDFQRLKIGEKLNTFLISIANRYGYKHMTAKIFSSNIPSLSLFKKFGYSVVGKQHKIGFIKNKWVDMILMEKLLHND